MTASPPTTVAHLEGKLAAFAGRRFCCLTGSATAGLYLALRALGFGRGKVIVPAVVCPSVANAVLYAGLEPVFCEVSLRDFNLDPAELERLASTLPDAVAVIPVHLYGYPAPMEEVLRIAHAHGLAVIEDAAQAMGAVYREQRVGSFGDISVLSFGHTKIIDAGAGGAVLTDNEALAGRLRAEAALLPPPPENLDELTSEYRRVHYTLKPLVDSSPRLNQLFFPLPEIFRAMHLFGATPAMAEMILPAVAQIEQIIEHRRTLAARYADRLRHPLIRLREADESGAVPWRFTFLLTDDRVKPVSEALRALGVPVSNWYPAIHRWYRDSAATVLPRADFIGSHVMNLWVDHTQTMSDVDRTTDAFLQLLDEPASLP